MDIANFLTQNGINYIYGHPYVVDTRISRYGQYYLNFYLPDYNIYIEYFSINKIVRQMNIDNSNSQYNNIILSLLNPIFNSYCAYLEEHKEIL